MTELNQRVLSLRKQGQRGSLYVVNLDEVETKINDWRRELPTVELFYAVKCNPDTKILALLDKLGVGFDCATQTEVKQALTLGVSPHRIIYSNPIKEPSHLKYAWENGVNLTVFDTEDELYKIKDISPTICVLLRIVPPVTDEKCIVEFSDKFGCHSTDVRSLLLVARTLNLDVCGVSFHVGSGCSDPRYFDHAIEASREAFDEAQKLGFQFRVLDIGGGFNGQNLADVSFKACSAAILDSLKKHFPPSLGLKIIAEPGQYVVRSAFTLVTDVIGKRIQSTKDNEDQTEDHSRGHRRSRFAYTINESTHVSFGNYSILFPTPNVYPLQGIESPLKHPSTIWGASCNGRDVIAGLVMLPELKLGDSLVFPEMGAYTIACASRFNGLPLPACFYYKQGCLIECKSMAGSISTKTLHQSCLVI